jgi:serine/threonine-protein kinase HipA
VSRSAKVYIQDEYAGVFRQDEDGYSFTYDHSYLNSGSPVPVSLTLPLQKEPYHSKTMIPFFDGLIPEGYFKDTESEVQNLNPGDRMGLLLFLCADCTGAISIIPVEEADHD